LLSVHYRIYGCDDIVGGVINHFGKLWKQSKDASFHPCRSYHGRLMTAA
jgi:hypothetical protein